MVILKGEKYLTDLDTWAIKTMRAHKMVWSGWGTADSLHGHFQVLPGSPWGIRRINGVDTKRLRLFFLSLLWRAAATSRQEFAEVEMPTDDLEMLRTMLLASQPLPLSFYPITLTQLSTRGVMQNMPPIADYKNIPSLIPGLPHRLERIYRFYFDGLLAHIHIPDGTGGADDYKEEGSFVLGAANDVVLSTVTYESSFQKENFDIVMSESNPTNLI
ncbi:MAG: hypothetical protein Q8L87_14660 [Anaerolineales bacterium]|nr:hypothetical protein [Anaerolineales bacterium]